MLLICIELVRSTNYPQIKSGFPCWLQSWTDKERLFTYDQDSLLYQHTCYLCNWYSVKNEFLKMSQNSQEKTCVGASFLIKLHSSCNFIKKETSTQVFPMNFAKFLRTSIFTEHLQCLLLRSTIFGSSFQPNFSQRGKAIISHPLRSLPVCLNHKKISKNIKDYRHVCLT